MHIAGVILRRFLRLPYGRVFLRCVQRRLYGLLHGLVRIAATRWRYGKLARAAVDSWRVARGKRAIFEDEWPPRMGVCRNGIKRSRAHATSGKSPLSLADMHAVRIREEVASASFRQAVARLGSFLVDALALRAPSSMAAAFLGVRFASEVAALNVSEVCVDSVTGVVDIKVRRRKNDQFGAGQLAHIAPLPSWGGACPLHLLSGWLWLRKWFTVYRDHALRLPGAAANAPLFVGLDRAPFGLSMAASGMSVSWGRALEVRNLSLRNGGARLYLMNEMSREATQKPGGR